jgi:hypothetical protein
MIGSTPNERGPSPRWKMRLIIAATFLLGVLLTAVIPKLGLPSWVQEILKEAGVAFMIAATIAATVDWSLKNDLIRNAFFAAFGYAFEPALQSEILRIATYRLICEDHRLRVKIEKIDSEAVRVTCEARRKIKNIGSSAENIGPSLHIDDWGFVQEHSKILECFAIWEKGKRVEAVEQVSSGHTIHFKGKELKLKPGKSVTMVTKWSEIRRHNDSIYVQFSCPTKNPEIDVPPVSGFAFGRSFGSASEEIEEVLSGSEVVTGTYLPHHYMIVRWRPSRSSESSGGGGGLRRSEQPWQGGSRATGGPRRRGGRGA